MQVRRESRTPLVASLGIGILQNDIMRGSDCCARVDPVEESNQDENKGAVYCIAEWVT